MKCPKCGGYGIITNYKHVESGVCFLCWGVGTITEEQHKKFQEEDNKKAVRRESKIAKCEEILQAQKQLHEERLKSGYYKKKREEEEQTRFKRLQEKHAAENSEFAQKTADESLKEFFALFDDED